MAIPNRTEIRLLLLELLSDGFTREKTELKALMAADLGLTAKELATRTANGLSLQFPYEFAWACTDLKKAGLIASPERAHFRITEEGRAVLAGNPKIMDEEFMNQFPGYRGFRGVPRESNMSLSAYEAALEGAELPPAPRKNARFNAEKYFSEKEKELAEEIRTNLFSVSSRFFKELIVRLLALMGYGISEGEVVGAPGDQGFDCVISEDKLGFSKIYIQAKRWAADQTVSRSSIQQFCGALADTGAAQPKGLFITTTRFSAEAREYAEKKNIVLIDGSRLAELMIAYDLGVSTKKTYTLKEISTDFFKEEEL